ncbi:MAG TPA: tetratricopeptide repeat protein [Caulobacteraceae bacterium]|nr:tetratricopeptide repeat protein [Caulobacteraceae bacterium]
MSSLDPTQNSQNSLGDEQAAHYFSQAVALHQRGQVAQAEAIYRKILAGRAHHAEALHMLGLLMVQTQRTDPGFALIDQALALRPDYVGAHYNRAMALAQLGRLEQALAGFERTLALSPGHLGALDSRGAILAEQGRPQAALDSFERLLAIKPDHVRALINRGVVLKTLQQPQAALESYDRALTIEPTSAEALNNRGVALMALERPGEALASFERALAVLPGYADAHFNRAMALKLAGRLDEALDGFDRSLAINPANPVGLNHRALVLAALKRPDDALASLDRALAIRPAYGEALVNRGVVLASLKRLDEALASYEAALAIAPDDAETLNNRALVLAQMDRLDEALAALDRALAVRPDYADAHYNRGAALKALQRPDEALASYDRALALAPEDAKAKAKALVQYAAALEGLMRLDDALACYDRALDIAPDHAEARFNKSLLLLLTGRFEEGWPLYESRLAHAETAAYVASRSLPGPAWTGETPLAGKTLFAYWEQGFGDTLQFCRYASVAADRGARVILSVQNDLKDLLAGFDPRVEVIGGDQAPAQFDLHASLLSLPLAFATTSGNIPSAPAYFKADADRARAWSARLGPKTRLRVGLAWTGNAAHRNDHNRSLPFRALAPLLSTDAEWICLQKDFREADRQPAADHPALTIFSDDLVSFAETAALIEALDLVIAVDTAVAHLAAGMGKPTWILLPFYPDWRWRLDRDESPWHPTARLFRQPRPGDWAAVVEQARVELTTFHDA